LKGARRATATAWLRCNDCHGYGFHWLACVPMRTRDPVRLRWPCHCKAGERWLDDREKVALAIGKTDEKAYRRWLRQEKRTR